MHKLLPSAADVMLKGCYCFFMCSFQYVKTFNFLKIANALKISSRIYISIMKI